VAVALPDKTGFVHPCRLGNSGKKILCTSSDHFFQSVEHFIERKTPKRLFCAGLSLVGLHVKPNNIFMLLAFIFCFPILAQNFH